MPVTGRADAVPRGLAGAWLALADGVGLAELLGEAVAVVVGVTTEARVEGVVESVGAVEQPATNAAVSAPAQATRRRVGTR